MSGPLHKTTIVIWSRKDPIGVELSDLSRQATEGEAYCSKQESGLVAEPEKDPDWDGTEFFDCGGTDHEEEGADADPVQ